MNRIKEIIKKFQYFKDSIYSSFEDMQYSALSLIEKVNDSYKYFYNNNQIDFQEYCKNTYRI